MGVSNTDKNTILDIFEQFECPPYDVRLAERYGLQGMINRDFSWQYTHARFDYLRDERKPSGQVVYEPSWEDSNYVWERELWDEVYASYLPSSPDNSASYPGDQMNSDLQVIVTDRQSIEEGIVVESAYVVISISDPGSRQPRVRRSAGFRGVLHLEFHDAEPMENGDAPRDIQLMTVEQAKAVWSFVTQHQDKVGAIVCHCEQGMSRSPAVAAALAVEFNCDLAEVVGYRQPNRYVFELIRSMLDAERTRRA
ncbi:MAG: hypothetical protein DWQ35_13975 [Planctomycetota bacterium]|nr:MAG: hypothetical protein DWQ35_13975 [Planctomycetota bacterium]REK25948.1 MAG: hypothetical protein DWQ42_09980 [Planctomycetota bacterium]REK46936.1 MAG: hypothetical protein DWQ46_05420 [Planctomycetota bacterium]